MLLSSRAVAALLVLAAALCLQQAAGVKSLERAKRQSGGDTKIFRVGAVLETPADDVLEIAVRRGIEVANGMFNKSSNLFKHMLVADIRRVPPGDSFKASLEACSLLESGVVAIVGPSSSQASEQVRSVCEYSAVPHIETNWNYRAPRQVHFSVNLSPHFETYAAALDDFVKTMVKTTRTAIIYKEPDSLLKYQWLLNNVETPILVRQWAKRSDTYMYVMKELRAARICRFFVDIPAEELVKFMITAMEMNMTADYHSYIFTSWDVHRIDLSDFQIVRGANFSTLSLMPIVAADAKYDRGPVVERMRNETYAVESRNTAFASLLANMLPISAATLFDSIILLASGLNQLSVSQTVQPQAISCSNRSERRMWQNGPSLLNFMRSMPSNIERQTLTGPVKFDAEWKRVSFSLTAYELTGTGFKEASIFPGFGPA